MKQNNIFCIHLKKSIKKNYQHFRPEIENELNSVDEDPSETEVDRFTEARESTSVLSTVFKSILQFKSLSTNKNSKNASSSQKKDQTNQ